MYEVAAVNLSSRHRTNKLRCTEATVPTLIHEQKWSATKLPGNLFVCHVLEVSRAVSLYESWYQQQLNGVRSTQACMGL